MGFFSGVVEGAKRAASTTLKDPSKAFADLGGNKILGTDVSVEQAGQAAVLAAGGIMAAPALGLGGLGYTSLALGAGAGIGAGMIGHQALTKTGAVGGLVDKAEDVLGGAFGGGGDGGGGSPKMGESFNGAIDGINSSSVPVSDPRFLQSFNTLSGISSDSRSRASDQWARFNNTYRPIEDRMVADANNIDSTGEQERVSGLAASIIQSQFDNAQQQNVRSQAAMGVNPNSGRAAASNADASLRLAAAKAGASSDAIQGVKDRGISMRSNVANFGNSTASRVSQFDSTAAGASASAASANTAALGAALDQENLKLEKNKTLGSFALGKYNADAGIIASQNTAASSRAAGIGNLIGTLGAAAISSKKVKENKKSVSDSSTLEKVKKGINVESWKYKDGVADSGEHIGAYAEDMHKQFGDKAAPGGNAIDMISMAGITLSAIKGLAKQVDKLEGKVGRITKTNGDKRTSAHA